MKNLAAKLIVLVLVVAGLLIWFHRKEKKVLKPIDELRVRITYSTEIPDPAKIDTAGEWYVLDHLSSGLATFDSQKKRFLPLYAESWSALPDGTHTFKIRPGIKFHDGTPITVKDILWSIKRQLLLKTSTHFPLWEYITGCEHLKSLEDECSGLRAISQNEIAIHLKMQTSSFFLQLASPETGIWSAADMDSRTAKLTPTKFSGPYFFASHSASDFLLKRNEQSPISAEFPNSPRTIRNKKLTLLEADTALANHQIDLFIRAYRPLGELNWQEKGIEQQSSTASTIIYLHGTGLNHRQPIGRDFVESAWKQNSDSAIFPAETFLPFDKVYGLSKDEFLPELPSKSAKRIRVLCPENYFSEAFFTQLKNAAQSAGTEIEYKIGSRDEWMNAFDDPKAAEKYDYILSIYAASERYPAVQLRYITGKLVKPPFDLKKAENPDLDDEKVALLKNYQKWLLKSLQVIPLYFNSTLRLYAKNIDLGAQPATDAEIELWRVQEQALL